jgi:hypothetical protein
VSAKSRLEPFGSDDSGDERRAEQRAASDWRDEVQNNSGPPRSLDSDRQPICDQECRVRRNKRDEQNRK